MIRMALPPRPAPHAFNEEALTRQRLVRVALGYEEADLILRGATVLNVQSQTWKKDWDIVISGQRIAWTGPREQWPGNAKEVRAVEGLWAVPGFGEAHKHIESTMLTPEYEADLVLRYGTTWNVEGTHEFSNVNGEKNVEFWLMARKAGSPFKVFPSLGSATPPTGWEETNGYYGYKEICDQIRQDPFVTGLDEVMDWAAVVDRKNPGYQRLWENIQATLDSRGVVEGHGYALTQPNEVSAYVAAGITSDHCVKVGEEAWNKLERGVFLELLPLARKAIKALVDGGLKDWSNVSVTTDDRNAETTLRQGAMDYNIRTAIEQGVPVEIAYSLGSYNTARHFRIDHWVGSITPGRYADIVLLAEPEKVVIEQVYSNGIKVSEKGKMLVPVPKVDYPEWATKTINLGGKVTSDLFVIHAPHGRETVNAALLTPFLFQPEFPTGVLPVKDGIVQRDEAQGVTKVALLDRYSGQMRASKMFWKDVGFKTPDSALCCSIAHDNHQAWVTGSSDDAMAVAINAMAEIDGGYVLVNQGKVVAKLRLEIGGLMTARTAEEFAADLLAMRAEMNKMEWLEKPGFPFQELLGIDRVTEAMNYGFLTCPPWYWVMVPPTDTIPSCLVNNRTGQTHPVIW
jgi:adenine deaminase